MDFREFSGKTVEDAIIEAATTLGIASSELDIEIVDQGKGGFLGLGAKPAVIKAKPKNDVKEDIDEIVANIKKPSRTGKKSNTPKKTAKPAADTKKKDDFSDLEDDFKAADVKAEEKAPEKAPEKEQAPLPEIEQNVIDETKVYLEKLFAAMEMEATIDITTDKSTRTMNIDVEGPEMGVIIGKRGQTLDSLQYLISLYVNKKSDTYIRVKLDTENYRERRRETLENLAKNIAYKVKKSRRPFTLEPMNPFERRIIHSTLQSDRFVTTRSEGEDPYRRVVVFPKKGGNNR